MKSENSSRGEPGPGTAETRVSKSRLKREAKARLALGKRLAELPEPVLRGLPLEADVLEAVLFARSIRSNVARKRQFGYLAGLLERADTRAVIDALDARDAEARQLTARHHRTEAWRDALLSGGDRALAVLLDQRHDVDVQALRQLLRSTARETAQGKPQAAARRLFRMLRDLDEASPLPPVGDIP